MYSNEQRSFRRPGISMEGVGLGLVVGCTGQRSQGGKRLGNCGTTYMTCKLNKYCTFMYM